MQKYTRIFIIALAITGVVLMSYLTYLHYKVNASSFCDIGREFSCSVVNKSDYSQIIGIPVSILGLLYFIGVLGFVIFRYNTKTLKTILFATIIFLGPSLYLTYIELAVLESICIFCEASKLLMLSIAGLAWSHIGTRVFPKNQATTAVILAVFAAAIIFIFHANQGPGNLYASFATCLNEKGFKMYGSASCSHCARQRAMFGDSFDIVEEIECNPRNPGAQVELCARKKITATPTWLQEDVNDNEIMRFPSGVQDLETLSKASGCPLPDKENKQR